MNRSVSILGLGAGALVAGFLAMPGEARAQERRFFQVTPGPRSAPPILDTTPSLPTPGAGGLQNVMVMDRATIARWLCPNGGTPVRGRPGRCDGRGTARGGSVGGGADSDVAGWFNDLPPASRRQVACPEGTVAAEARANPGVVRCLPKPDDVRQASARTAPAETAEAPARPVGAAAPAAEPARPAAPVPDAAPDQAAAPAAPAPARPSPQAEAAGGTGKPTGS